MIAAISDEDAIMIVIDRNAIWIVELARLVALLAELGHERAAIIITREYLHSVVPAIDNKQETSMMVEYQAKRIVELAISIAWLLGADRELDSSITIKNIVSHLFQFNLSLSLTLSLSLSLSLSHNDKEMIQAPNCSNQRDEDMKLSLTHETRERHQASKQRAIRSNKNQSMKEQRTASPSLNQPLPHSHEPLLDLHGHDSARCLHALPIHIKRERERE